MKKILFAASEAVPFIKTGGLADVVGSLPKYFPKEEYDVRVVLPKYLCMGDAYRDETELVAECQVSLNWRTQYAGVYQLALDGITFYFIDNEYYFAGPAPYGEIYQDAEKFAFFSKAVLTILPVIDFAPDILHCHDWQTGLISVFLEAQYRQEEFYHHIRTVYTIHNLKFQGRWYLDAIRDVTGLPPEYFTVNALESYGQANFLKGGVVFADYVTTVSESYAKEIQTVDGGEGLDGLLAMRSFRLSGIVNGLDYTDQNPKTDPRIACNLADDVTAYKQANKAALQKQLGLAERGDAFLIGMVSRLTDQKGFDLVDYILDEILGMETVQIVVLGTGEERYENMFRHFAGKYPGRVSANLYYSEDLAQQIYASCDAFLMPSLFEPCGLSQLMALRYGTVPLVRETGGLKDTVEPYNEFEHTGTGFSFHNYNAHEMLYMVRYAEKIYSQYPDEWRDIVARGMAEDFSWDASCKKYATLYDGILEEEARRSAEEQSRREEEERLEKLRQEEERKLRLRMEREAKEAEEKAAAEKARAAEEKAAAEKVKKAETAKQADVSAAETAKKSSAEKKTSVGKKSSAETSAEKKSSAEKKTSAGEKSSAEKKSAAGKKTPAEKKVTAEKTPSQKKNASSSQKKTSSSSKE